MHQLTLYSRPGCHLCEDMADALTQFSDELQFKVTVYNIEDDPELHERYNVLVPIVFYQEKEIFRYHFELASLKSTLRE